MKIYILVLFLVTQIFAAGQNGVNSSLQMCADFEIQESKTDLNAALNALGKPDFLIKTYACGSSSGYISQLYIFKKLGIAITSKTGLTDKVELIDTLKLPYYEDGAEVFLNPVLQNITTLFGYPNKTFTLGQVTELTYQNTGIKFIIDNKTKKMIKLVLIEKLLNS